MRILETKDDDPTFGLHRTLVRRLPSVYPARGQNTVREHVTELQGLFQAKNSISLEVQQVLHLEFSRCVEQFLILIIEFPEFHRVRIRCLDVDLKLTQVLVQGDATMFSRHSLTSCQS